MTASMCHYNASLATVHEAKFVRANEASVLMRRIVLAGYCLPEEQQRRWERILKKDRAARAAQEAGHDQQPSVSEAGAQEESAPEPVVIDDEEEEHLSGADAQGTDTFDSICHRPLGHDLARLRCTVQPLQAASISTRATAHA